MQFNFKAKNFNGQLLDGTREAFDRETLARSLREEGYVVTNISELRPAPKSWLARHGLAVSKVSLRDKITFAGNLSAMLEAGLSLSRALSVLERQTTSKSFKAVITNVSSAVTTGKSLSEALLNQGGAFPPVFTAMVSAGEESGTLPASLKLVSEQLEKSYELQRKIKGAMIYPAIIVAVIIIIGILMMMFVVPTLTATFKDLHVDLPLSTRIIIGISDFLTGHYLFLGCSLLLGVVVVMMVRKTPRGHVLISSCMLHLPVISKITKEFNASLVMRTMASLITAGVSLSESLRVTSSVVSNVKYKEVLQGSIEAIESGINASQIFKAREDLFPPLVGEMTEVGEETGELSKMLLRGAIFFEGEVDNATKNISTIIEPVLLVFIGVAVGFFAISMIGPMYSLSEAL